MLIARGIADPERLGLWGFSNGASITNYLITRTDRFKAAVSCGGVSDWIEYFLLIDVDDFTQPDMFRGRTPWTDQPTYIAASAIYHLDRVKTPLLLVVGDRDRTLLGHLYMFNGLRRLGREVTLVRYPEDGHVLKPASARDYDARVVSFFSKHLLR